MEEGFISFPPAQILYNTSYQTHKLEAARENKSPYIFYQLCLYINLKSTGSLNAHHLKRRMHYPAYRRMPMDGKAISELLHELPARLRHRTSTARFHNYFAKRTGRGREKDPRLCADAVSEDDGADESRYGATVSKPLVLRYR